MRYVFIENNHAKSIAITKLVAVKVLKTSVSMMLRIMIVCFYFFKY